ncbi:MULTISPECIES: alpha/beta fold hydrolase [unclassified Microbacterium]|uniref:alpha/beta fold hydrolase n=1 Tax=unclassified Microbacterium TaxID=2609290 RepID=UPI003017BF8D
MPHPLIHRRTLHIDGLRTSFLEAGRGAPLVLLHGGEFGAAAEFSWERIIPHLAVNRRVIAPDVLGFGGSAKTVDFADGRGYRTRHVAALLRTLGIGRADFAGNSMGGVMLLVDGASDDPTLDVRRQVIICGGGEILDNEHAAALYEYDGTIEAMGRIVHALFHDPSYAADAGYVRRRWESSTQPGAWEAVASARFRPPGHASGGGGDADYTRLTAPTLVIEGEHDKLKPSGWSALLADALPHARALVAADAGHCPQIEHPLRTARQMLDFLDAADPIPESTEAP